jgi:putative phosphoesterase
MKILPSLDLDLLIFCGDIFGYYYGQQEIIETLRYIPNLVWLLGNHDKNYLDMMRGKTDARWLIEKYGNSFSLAKSLNYVVLFESLLLKQEILVEETHIIAVHGTLENPLCGRLYPNDIAKVTAVEPDVVIMGHTHFRLAERVDKTLFLNPGSLGQPRDKFPAGIAVLTLPQSKVNFVDIVYDRELLETEIHKYDPNNQKLIDILHRAD